MELRVGGGVVGKGWRGGGFEEAAVLHDYDGIS